MKVLNLNLAEITAEMQTLESRLQRLNKVYQLRKMPENIATEYRATQKAWDLLKPLRDFLKNENQL